MLIFRPKTTSGHSIEALFHSIADHLDKENDLEIIRYESRGLKYALSDALILRRIGADVYHVTADVNYLTLFLPWQKVMLTIPDIGHYLYDLKGIKRIVYKYLWLTLPILVSKIVTTISVETKDNIENYLGFKKKQIIQIDCCYNEKFKFKKFDFNSKYPRILQVGTGPLKNLQRLIKALDGINCVLIIIGKLSNENILLLQSHNISYENYSNLTFESLFEQYSSADIVSFISIAEGFGVPVIEAQALGKPLITSDVQPISRIAARGALKVSPFSIEKIHDGILKIINNESYRKYIIQEGYENSKKYSCYSVSNLYLNLYRTYDV